MDQLKNPKGVGMFADDDNRHTIDGNPLSDGSRYVTEKIGDLIIGLSTLLLSFNRQ